MDEIGAGVEDRAEDVCQMILT